MLLIVMPSHNEKKPPPMTASEGTAFAQKQGKKNGANKGDKKAEDGETKHEKNDKKFFADKECFVCGKNWHGAKHCPNKVKKLKKSKDAKDSSISSKSSRSEDLAKKIKSANKQFTQLKVQFEDSNDSELDDEQSHFQFLHFSTIINQRWRITITSYQ